MASSSLASSSSTPGCSTQQWNYDVYLCFRGTDTGKSFVGHLYAALYQRGILTYLDTETLPHGVPIDATLFNAIKESRIAIVVLSKNFANSSFCLNELAYIIKCRDEMGQIVIPIYYHVHPSEVRKQEGAFSSYKWEIKNDYNKFVSWRNALVDIASKDNGWIVGDIPESVCIRQVVDTISNKLFPNKGFIKLGTDLQDLKLRGTAESVYHHSRQINTSVTSSISTKLAKYDVFLSFRGEDTRFNFVDHLYSALEQHKILTYMDKEIKFSGPLHSHSINAIEEARISIIIFSINYASSSLCLDELAYMMKCRNETGQIVIPLYYHVDPSEVRKQSGKYEIAFPKHGSMKPSKVELWRNALVDASSLRGWNIVHIADGHEAKGIRLIVKKISNILFPDKDLIGLRTRLEDMTFGGGGGITIPPFSQKDMEHLRIPLHEILLATNNLSENNIIAVGGFGKVYQGLSEQHGTIAVKQLDRRHGQGDHEFMMEIALLSAYKHENLVSLVGYCDKDGEKILVLKYEINGSLDKHVHRKDLTWIQRLQICLDVAKGLKYLHEDVGAQHRILHRDVKSSNILLDENWKAKISDFGLSKNSSCKCAV
ncbi:putative protein kinase RLK-Pelle-CrRLK1L-1 family [Helianthus annuus]|uniref:disease resistance protein RPS4 n=1 Tax=Helianthus annuus TaxID=4232 RepID=UPI0016532FF1|nr:disease resistance protein RPS4 [Helianthus annuus]KAJ0488724.1 putative protein kinase RLK-Pelle-CrRLK1L-1 family [Helianthus annuus]KAJ0492281.1 putative protein kinase RLK-Pelle-CrRLK1L-1 family [Helianthus annuus]KAJ0504562.1 putative protein kinase RLK-Pelle-CrRLK1L-1 family [Helianthus annuus]